MFTARKLHFILKVIKSLPDIRFVFYFFIQKIFVFSEEQTAFFFPHLFKFFINSKASLRKILKLTIQPALFSAINLDCKNLAQALNFSLRIYALGEMYVLKVDEECM